MILKDVNGDLIFPAMIEDIKVMEWGFCLNITKPRSTYVGAKWALAAGRYAYDGDLGIYVPEWRAIAMFDDYDRAEVAKQELLDGFVLTIPSKVVVQ